MTSKKNDVIIIEGGEKMNKDDFTIWVFFGAILVIPALVTELIVNYLFKEEFVVQLVSAVATGTLSFIFFLVLTMLRQDVAYRIAGVVSPTDVDKVVNGIRLMLLIVTGSLSVLIPVLLLTYVL